MRKSLPVLLLLAAALCLVLAPATVAPPASSAASPVSIYIGPFVRDGFVDADEGVSDSVKDIKKRLLKERQFRLVSDAESAALAVYVVLRGTSTVAGEGSTVHYPGTVVRFPNGQVIQTPGMSVEVGTQLRHVGALLRVGEYERPFVVETDWAWGRCADQIVKDLTGWLRVNRKRLVARGGEETPDTPGREGLRLPPGLLGPSLPQGDEGTRRRPAGIGSSVDEAVDEVARRSRDTRLGLPTGTGENQYGLRFDPRGADFTVWMNHFKNQVYRNWHVPQAVFLGYGGQVDFEFTVERDGSMSWLRMLRSSGTDSLDRRAREALTHISRFMALPDDYGPPRVTMQVTFHYGPPKDK